MAPEEIKDFHVAIIMFRLSSLALMQAFKDFTPAHAIYAYNSMQLSMYYLQCNKTLIVE